MSRTTRIIIVMALLLLSMSFVRETQAAAQPPPPPAPTADATSSCGWEIGQTWSGLVLVQLYGCFSWSSTINLDAFGLDCRATAIGIAVSNLKPYEFAFWSGGRRYVRTGCTWTKSLAIAGLILAQTSCYLYADNYVARDAAGRLQLHIGPTRSNWC